MNTLYTIKSVNVGPREYFVVFDVSSDTSSHLFASFKEAFDALAKAFEQAGDAPVNARNI